MRKRLQDKHDQELPTFVSCCLHGENDSWSTKRLLEEQGLIANEILARGIAPTKRTPQRYPDGTERAIQLTIDEIADAAGIVIHNSNLASFRSRFGTDFANQLIALGLLLVRTGRETQFSGKDTRAKRQRKAITCDYKRLFRDFPVPATDRIREQINTGLLQAASQADQRWQSSQKTKKGNRR